MKVEVFIALQEMILDQAGLDVWHGIVDAVDSDGVLTATLNYPDEDLMALVVAVCGKLNISTLEV